MNTDNNIKQLPNVIGEQSPDRKNSTKGLIFLSAVGVILSISLIIALVIVLIQSKKNSNLCMTSACVTAASSSLSYIDKKLDPCHNFYKFACGNYIKDAVIPEGKPVVSVFHSTIDATEIKLSAVFNEPMPKNASRPYKMFRDTYKVCMNTDAIDRDGLTTINKVLKNFGGWPLLEGKTWNETNFQWYDVVAKQRNYGGFHGFFMSVRIAMESKNISRRLLALRDSPLKIQSQLLKGFDYPAVRAYYHYLIDLAVEFGVNKTTAEKELKDVIEFKIKLANILLTRSLTQAKLTSVKGLQEDFPKIDWIRYFNSVVSMSNVSITDDEPIVIFVPNYLRKLEILLTDTPKRVLANYMLTETVEFFVPYLSKKLRLKRLTYMNDSTIDFSSKLRSLECKKLTILGVGLELDYLYVTRYFNESTKRLAEALAYEIRSEFKEILKKVPWLDDTTRNSAIEKVTHMTQFIAYPSELVDYQNVEKYYEKLEIDSNNFLNTYMAIRKFQQDENYRRLREQVNKTSWLTHTIPTTVNAFYAPYENSIQFPAAILQGWFFNKDRPNYFNYGMLGFIIGHEVTHGFDNMGGLFDKDGNYKNWWSKQTKLAFSEKAQCIIEQYGNYTYPELNLTINGESTQGENIADNGGIKQAYAAYNRWAKRNGPELQLPGLDYTPNQMFWIAAAQLWCSKISNSMLKSAIAGDPHSPGEYRVIGSFSNNEDFVKDFKCPVGSPMNRKNKCNVW